MKYGFICIMDALGTKGSWRQETPEDFIAKLEKLHENLRGVRDANINQGVGEIDVQVFSDTVFVTYHCPTDADRDPVFLLPWFASLVAVPFVFAMLDGLFLRGAISQGQFHKSESMLVGPAVDDAASYYEQADWLGVICTPSASFGVEYATTHGAAPPPEHCFISYDVPLKNSVTETLNVVDWPKLNADQPGLAITRSQLMGAFSRSPIPIIATSKYKNTLRFFDYSEKRRRDLKT